DSLRANFRHSVFRDAGEPDLVPLERLYPAGPVSPRHGTPAALRPAHRPGNARTPNRIGCRPPSVLHGEPRRIGRHAGLQGLRRHHEPVAGRRLHRNPIRPRDRREGLYGGGNTLLGGLLHLVIWSSGHLVIWFVPAKRPNDQTTR